MIEFINNYWQLIVLVIGCISVILSIIILLIKHVPLTRIVKVIELVPTLISQAEKIFPISSSGADKKQYVKDLFDYLLELNGISKYSKYFKIDDFIEEVLASPSSKKGEHNEKENAQTS